VVANKYLVEQGGYDHGLKNGDWKKWYINGEYSELQHYKKGTKDGGYRSFYESGGLKLIGHYVNDEKNGQFVHYDQEGKVVLRESFNEGERHGKHVVPMNDTLQIIKSYRKGEVIKIDSTRIK